VLFFGSGVHCFWGGGGLDSYIGAYWAHKCDTVRPQHLAGGFARGAQAGRIHTCAPLESFAPPWSVLRAFLEIMDLGQSR